MYLKKEKEFQYHPAIVKMIEDVVGGGTIDRSDLVTCLFDNKPLDELPPFCVVFKNSAGSYNVIKTVKAAADATADATSIKVIKNHLFLVDDFLMITMTKTLKITAIDKSDNGYDVITLSEACGGVSIGDILTSASAIGQLQDLEPDLVITMAKVDLTVANQSCGLMVRGTIIEDNMPFPISDFIKAKMPHIRFI